MHLWFSSAQIFSPITCVIVSQCLPLHSPAPGAYTGLDPAGGGLFVLFTSYDDEARMKSFLPQSLSGDTGILKMAIDMAT